MKKALFFSAFSLFFITNSFAQWQTPVATESFSSKRVVNSSPLRHPFAMVMGPDDSLWITERRGYVMRVNPNNGGKTQLLDIRSLVKFTVTTNSPYTSLAGATNNSYTSAAGATSTGNVITVGSTTNLAVSMLVSVSSGTGAFPANTSVTSIINSTTFTVSAAPTTALSASAVVRGYGNIITVGSTTNLQVGMTVLVTSGGGAFPVNTTVTSITSGTKFVVSAVPTTPLSASAVVKVVNVTGISQDGMFGLALHPELNKGTGKDSVYLAYCYDSAGLRRVKIVAYKYNRSVPSLTGETVLIKGIWGSNDHNGGRLVIGNFGTSDEPDYKIVYTVGDKGANQFGNACDSIESQYTPTAAQMATNDIHRYNGKILRLNLDGSIPTDNPVINGVRTHVWTYGHRNPQGLSFEKKPNLPMEVLPGGKLYESEQGPATNDEINIINGAGNNNYGWPRVAGKKDNNWYRYFQWSGSGSCGSYGGECSSNQTSSPLTESTFSSPKLADPIFDLYAGTPSGGTSCNWLAYPTIAPSSVIHYPFINKIPGWNNCLLITTLKTSSVFRLKLNAAGTAPALTAGATGNDSVVQYFKTTGALNRYRDIVVGNDGVTFYLLTDSVGTTSGPSAGAAGVTDPGRILEFIYLGSILSVGGNPPAQAANRTDFKIYPNPVSDQLTVECKRNTAKPLHYKMFDAAGRILLKGSSIRDKFELDVHTLKHGVYILKVFDAYNINVATEKVLVK